MVSRYHWLTGGVNQLGVIPATAHDTLLTFPGSAIIKRFMLRETRVVGLAKSNFPEFVSQVYMDQQVHFVSGVNTGRVIYSSSKSIPCATAVDPLDLITPYKGWYQAGDVELGFNQQCSYGNVGDPPAQLTFTHFIYGSGPYTSNISGELNVQFAVLYYL